MPILQIHPTLRVLPEARRRHLVRGALHFWHEGDDHIRQPHRSADHQRYERAVTQVLRAMHHLTTMEALLAHYYVNRTPLMRLTESACRSCDGTHSLSRVWVRDAAFWRHFRHQLCPPGR